MTGNLQNTVCSVVEGSPRDLKFGPWPSYRGSEVWPPVVHVVPSGFIVIYKGSIFIPSVHVINLP